MPVPADERECRLTAPGHTAGAFWHAFRAGTPDDRTIIETCEAVGVGHTTEGVLAAFCHLENSGEFIGCVFDRGAEAEPGSWVRRLLYRRECDAPAVTPPSTAPGKEADADT